MQVGEGILKVKKVLLFLIRKDESAKDEATSNMDHLLAERPFWKNAASMEEYRC
jgi:hypothetical protein